MSPWYRREDKPSMINFFSFFGSKLINSHRLSTQSWHALNNEMFPLELDITWKFKYCSDSSSIIISIWLNSIGYIFMICIHFDPWKILCDRVVLRVTFNLSKMHWMFANHGLHSIRLVYREFIAALKMIRARLDLAFCAQSRQLLSLLLEQRLSAYSLATLPDLGWLWQR